MQQPIFRIFELYESLILDSVYFKDCFLFVHYAWGFLVLFVCSIRNYIILRSNIVYHSRFRPQG